MPAASPPGPPTPLGCQTAMVVCLYPMRYCPFRWPELHTLATLEGVSLQQPRHPAPPAKPRPRRHPAPPAPATKRSLARARTAGFRRQCSTTMRPCWALWSSRQPPPPPGWLAAARCSRPPSRCGGRGRTTRPACDRSVHAGKGRASTGVFSGCLGGAPAVRGRSNSSSILTPPGIKQRGELPDQGRRGRTEAPRRRGARAAGAVPRRTGCRAALCRGCCCQPAAPPSHFGRRLKRTAERLSWTPSITGQRLWLSAG